jgi:hypothetical protein
MRAGLAAALLVVVACGGGGAETTTVPASPGYDRQADAYAVSAERALVGTAYEVLGVDGTAAVIVDLCEGLGFGAISAIVAGLDPSAPARDRTILDEVLRRGVDQVCSDRAAIDLTPIYLDAVSGAVAQAGAEAAYDEAAVVRAASVACAAFDGGGDGEDALVGVAAALFDVDADSIADLDVLITPEQGVVTGATLSAATALLCPDEIESVAELLGSP